MGILTLIKSYATSHKTGDEMWISFSGYLFNFLIMMHYTIYTHHFF